MTNELTLLTKENFGGIELDFYRNEENEIFMTAKQLGEALEYAYPQRSIDKIVTKANYLENEDFSVKTKMVSTDGKAYETRIFTEDGLYEVTMISKQPKALEFRAFVRKLLKGLRKNELTVVSNSPSYMIEDPIARAEQWIAEQKQRRALVFKNETMKPKVEFYEKVMSSENVLTTTQIAKELGTYASKLNNALHKLGVQYKVGGQWVLYSPYQDKGYTKSVTSLDPQGKHDIPEDAAHVYTKWTHKGRQFIHELIKEKGITFK